jgi:uncharacterized protein
VTAPQDDAVDTSAGDAELAAPSTVASSGDVASAPDAEAAETHVAGEPAGGETGDAAVDEGPGDEAAEEPHPDFVVVEVVNVSYELPSPSPILHLLEETAPYRGLYFPVGLPEAQSIALALANEQAPRPNTHDLLVSVLAAAGCEVVAVRITGERGGTLLAELDLMGPRGHEVVDCRPTDGIAIALRLAVPAPILCEAGLLDH